MLTRQTCFSLILLTCALPIAGAQIQHRLTVSLEPNAQTLSVTDTVTLPAGHPTPAIFTLHAGLAPTSPDEGVRLTLLGTRQATPPRARYRVELPAGQRRFTLRYGGKIHHPLRRQGKAYARSFTETPGLISAAGVYLSSRAFWYPQFEKALVTFQLEVHLPEAMDVVSQGVRTVHAVRGARRHVRWQVEQPQDDIYLIAAGFHEYTRQAGAVTAMAFLRTPDPTLASRYLEATARYIEMYRQLLGPYPYAKFALVENFWETGYGMPSFTLLGPRVIRLPFILHSSYPHEILHNWWGNGVFVDYESGNWCEGLTAYLADHLIQEQRGRAASYRRSTLQGYADYAAEGNDFPLARVRARHSAATQAVGYGKCLMLFHMLRLRLGDKRFTRALRTFYRGHRGQRAGFADLRKAFSDVAGEDLTRFFEQWVNRTGAPQLAVSDPSINHAGRAKFQLTVKIEQLQAGPAYALRVPVAVWLAGRAQPVERTVVMTRKTLRVTLMFEDVPVRFQLDPRFDLFRRLDRREIPPALSQVFGARKPLVVLPSAAPAPRQSAYSALARRWQLADIKTDAELTALPADRAVWLLGWDNRFREKHDLRWAKMLADKPVRRSTHSAVLVTRHPGNPQLALAWVGADNLAAIPGLARKLPHYGKYGYLAFTGDAPTNVIKGQWPVNDAPTTIRFDDEATGATPPPRAALAQLPPVFDGRRMLRDVSLLAGARMAGRGFGRPELDRAATHIATAFRKAGLQPGGEDGFFQRWKATDGQRRTATLTNVIGVIPGTLPEWKRQVVVLSAHYDHLGPGLPGADDNASGVAVLLELARIWGRGWRPKNTVLLIGFSGEEHGLLGSRHFVSELRARCMAAVNLDSVGRLGKRTLMVLGTGSATEWSHIFRGIGWVTGIQTRQVAKDPGGSDQVAFHEAGIPAVQLFSGPHPDYHRASDTADKIDVRGLIQTATVVKQAMQYLAGRTRPLTTTLASRKRAQSPDAAGGRRFTLGTIPDFAHRGKGVRLSGVMPGSPAAKAGLKAGDVVTGMDGRPLAGLRAYASALRALKAKQRVTLQYLRAGTPRVVTLQPVRR